MHSADPEFLRWRSSPSRETLRSLLRAHQDRVYSLCFQVLRHAHDAEDAAQASLLEIARGAGSIKDPQAFSSWLYRVCLNNALTLRREQRRRKQREEGRAAMTPIAAAPETDDVRDAIHDALARLNDDDRSIVVEHYLEKATLDDLGSRRGISGPAAWKRIEQAKEKMRRALAGTGLGIGVTQMNSVLEAAEFVSAPSGFTADAALSAGPGKSLVPKVLIGAGAATLMLITAALITSGDAGPEAITKGDRPSRPSRNPQALPPLPEPATAPPTPPQEPSPHVLDPEGRPLKGALVFPGRWYRLRGDDAFDPFRPRLIKDGVTTDAEGRFKLETASPFVTAWHDEYGPTTVSSTESVIRMKARGTLKGRLVDAEGKGREGIEITLDKRGPKARTDANGAFKFEKVIAGYRGLILPDQRRIAVRVDAGETLDVEIGAGVDVTLELSAHPNGDGVEINAGLLGAGRMSSVVAVVGKSPAVELKGVLPGRYQYWEVRRGPRGWVDISEKGAKVEFGSSTVEILSAEPVTFYLVHAGINEMVEVALTKDGPLKAEPGVSAFVRHLVEGDYEVRDLEGVTLERFKVGPGETRVTLTSK